MPKTSTQTATYVCVRYFDKQKRDAKFELPSNHDWAEMCRAYEADTDVQEVSIDFNSVLRRNPDGTLDYNVLNTCLENGVQIEMERIAREKHGDRGLNYGPWTDYLKVTLPGLKANRRQRFLWIVRELGEWAIELDLPTQYDNTDVRDMQRYIPAYVANLDGDWANSDVYLVDYPDSVRPVTHEEAKAIAKQAVEALPEVPVVDRTHAIQITDKDYFDEVQAIADASPHKQTFYDCLNRLRNMNPSHERYHVNLYRDFAGYSFTWSAFVDGMQSMHGGMIYHENLGWRLHT